MGIKQEMAGKIQAMLIAEGISTEWSMEILVALAVNCVAGVAAKEQDPGKRDALFNYGIDKLTGHMYEFAEQTADKVGCGFTVTHAFFTQPLKVNGKDSDLHGN